MWWRTCVWLWPKPSWYSNLFNNRLKSFLTCSYIYNPWSIYQSLAKSSKTTPVNSGHRTARTLSSPASWTPEHSLHHDCLTNSISAFEVLLSLVCLADSEIELSWTFNNKNNWKGQANASDKLWASKLLRVFIGKCKDEAFICVHHFIISSFISRWT